MIVEITGEAEGDLERIIVIHVLHGATDYAEILFASERGAKVVC